MKAIIKSFINWCGYDLRRFRRGSSPSSRLFSALEHFKVDLVLDIGANAGQFASDLISAGYRGELVSFEPLSAAHQQLLNAARRHPNWRVHSRAALGDADAEMTINIAGNSVSSSVLPIMSSHSSAAKDSAYVGAEKVPMFKLDTLAAGYLANARKPFLKIDTQGYEWQVLDGATQTLPLLHGICCELSLVSLYEGQRLWLDIMQRLEHEGFVLWSIERGFTDQRDGRTLQVDATFFRV